MPSASSSKKGFTLFELLIVIVLIAVLYGIFINKLTVKPHGGESAAAVTIETLGTYLQPFAEAAEGGAALVCLDECRECSVYAGGKRVEKSTIALFERAPSVYRKDGLGQFQKVAFLPVKNSDGVLQNVCFRYDLFENGSRSSYIVGYNDAYYLFDAYLRPVTTYRTLEAAEAAYNKTALIPDDERLYTF
jgi:prepilin-type N-terminal cleavage/methylation domain-containing protein